MGKTEKRPRWKEIAALIKIIKINKYKRTVRARRTRRAATAALAARVHPPPSHVYIYCNVACKGNGDGAGTVTARTARGPVPRTGDGGGAYAAAQGRPGVPQNVLHTHTRPSRATPYGRTTHAAHGLSTPLTPPVLVLSGSTTFVYRRLRLSRTHTSRSHAYLTHVLLR